MPLKLSGREQRRPPLCKAYEVMVRKKTLPLRENVADLIGAMNNTTDLCMPSFSITKYFKIPIYSIVLAAGLPLNCLALWVLAAQIKRSVVLSVYILNLVLANVLQTLTLPFWMYHSYHDHSWGLGEATCAVAGLAFRTNFYAKNNFLCLIAMERFIGLVHPLKFHRLQTIQGAAKVCVGTWVLVAVLCSVGIWLQVKGTDPGHGRCLDASSWGYAHFRLATTCLSFFVPFLLMGFFYFSVLFELRKVTSLEKKVKRQIYGFVSLIIASFFLLFIPYQVTSYYKFLSEVTGREKQNCEFERSIFIYTQTTLSLTTLDNILDPLLYILLLKDVRAELKDLICRKAHNKTGISYKLKDQGLPPHATTGQMLD